MVKHLNIRVRGEVQGVSFRHYVTEQAAKLGLTGFVRNEPAGDVYLEAEGEEAALQKLADWCRHGPAWARVDKIELSSGGLKNFTAFRFIY